MPLYRTRSFILIDQNDLEEKIDLLGLAVCPKDPTNALCVAVSDC